MKPKIKTKYEIKRNIQKNRLNSEEVAEIIKRYPSESAQSIAGDYGISISTVYKTAQRYGVKKSEEFLKSPLSGRIAKGQHLSPSTEIQKGQVMSSRHMKMTARIKKKESWERWQAGLWKKGHKPHNTGKDGEIRWRKNPGYWFIRISENNWEFYHRYLWTQAYGQIPEGYNVVFKDGNQKNCDITNLECISNAELSTRNAMKDGLTAFRMAAKRGEEDLRRELLNHRRLLDLKKQQLILNKQIKQNGRKNEKA